MRFSGFDDEWKTYKLKDLLHNKSSSISINQLDDNVGNYPLYGASGFLKCIDFYEMDSDYISIVKDGSGVGNISFHEKNTSVVNTSQYILPKENLNIHFIFYLLQTINLNKYKTGSTIPHIYFKDYSIEKVKIPKYDEQKKIGILLKNLDAKIEILDNKLQMCQNFKKYLMQQIFTQKLRFADCTGEWNLFKLGDIVELMRNGCSENQVSFETEFPVTRIETISKGILNFDKVGYVEKIDSSYLLQYGDILLSNINSLKYIGNCVFFDEDKTLYHGMNLMLMRFKDDFNKKYLFYYMKFYQQWFQKMACQAVNQASINQSSLKKFPFYIPPTIDEQNKIVNVIDDTEHKINSIKDQIIKMKDFKKGLLQQMFVVRINWRCNFKLAKSPSFNKHLLILKNKIIFIIIE